MYILQDGKLYVAFGAKLVGVSIYPDKVVRIKGSTTEYGDDYEMLTKKEVVAKFQINDTPYEFPKKEKDVVTPQKKDGE